MSDAKLSNQQTLEWETRARDWLSAMPKTRDITTDEMDGWIDSPHSSLPEDLKSLPRSHIHQRILFIHHLIRQSYQEMDAVQVEPQPPRFQRTDQWMPVYSWLESLEKNEVVKPNEIIDWLSENPGVRDQLHSKHSRHHLMHYIQRCHFKMLRRRERQRKRMQAMQPPTTSPEVKALNNGVTTAAVPLRCAGNGFKLDAGSHGGYAGRHREKWIPSSEDMLSLPLAGSHLVDNFRNLLCGLNGEVTHHGFLHGVPIHQAWLLHNPFSRYACQIMVF